MSAATVALLLLGCAGFGALLGTTPSRVRTGWLVATAIAAPAGDLQQGTTSCRFIHGSVVPEFGPLDGEETGGVLQLIGALLAAAAVLLVRRRRSAGASRSR